MSRRRQTRRLMKTEAEPAKVGKMLRDFGVAHEDDPESVQAYWDAQGRPRRVHARWPDGWTATLFLHSDGGYSLSQNLKITVPAKLARGGEL